MKKIFKYQLKITDNQQISMPIDAIILSVQIQYESICIWAMIDEANPLKNRKIVILGTGHEIDKSLILRFIGTVQINYLVFHVFEQLN